MNAPRSGARRTSGSRRRYAGFGAALLGGAIAICAAAAPVSASVPLVILHRDHVARSAPSLYAPRVATVAARRPLTDVPTVLPVLGRATSADGRRWLRVALPGRPNQGRGWITLRRTAPSHTHWRLVVELDARVVVVRRFGRVVRRFRAVVGKPSTPTPRGRFFVEEAMALGPLDAGGPYALATSARSDVLQEFDGGPGQIALHGRNHLGGALGTASSHGCVRLSTVAITWLSQRIGAGVPVTITK